MLSTTGHDHVGLKLSDMDRSLHFYQDVELRVRVVMERPRVV